MKRLTNQRVTSLRPLALAMATLFSQALIAQDQNEEEQSAIEEIVVTGSYRASLSQAVDMKRLNPAISDSLIATDIADFPDQNLAEALQRIPGVAIERDKGMGTKVNVRSLGVEYTHTTINNVSTSSGSGGRDVNFDIFASELIQSVTVKKSPLASDEEGGVAGVVAINTAKPFDYQGNRYVANLQAAYNDLSEKTDPRYSFLISQNKNDKFGFLVSFAAEDRTVRTDQADTAEFKTLGTVVEDAYDITYEKAINNGLSDAQAEQLASQARSQAIPQGVSEDVLYAENIRDDIMLNAQEKWGVTTALQYRPNTQMLWTLDVMAGNFKGKEDDYMFGSWTGDVTRAYDLTIDNNNIITKGSFDNAQHEFKSYDRYRDEDYHQASLNFDWDINQWQIKTLLGYSGAQRSYQRTQAKWTNYAAITQEYTDNGMIRYSSDLDLANDVEEYSFVFWDFDNTKTEDQKYVGQADVIRDMALASLPSLTTIQFGTRYSEKSMDYDHGWTEVKGETVYQGEGGRQYTSEEWVGTPLPVDQIVSVNTLIPGGDYMQDMPGKFDAWMAVPNAWAREQYYVDGLTPNYFFNDHFRVDEDVLALYAMADFDFDIGRFPAALNVGGRYIRTEQQSYGYQNVDGEWSTEPVMFEANYNDFLPSLNLAVDLTDDILLRFSAAKVMTRASLGQLSGKRNISTNDKTIDMGNPQLNPLRATQADIALEYYADEDTFFAITAFYKDLKSFITEAKIGTTDYQGEEFEVYSFVNGKGSSIRGAEIIAQFPFTHFSSALQGFGVNANYTWVDSSNGHISDIGLEVPMFGLSKQSYNATLYFEKADFDFRLSYNFKGESVQNLEDNLYPVYRDDYGQFDLSAGYQIHENVKLTTQVINLTDEYISEYQVQPRYPMMYQVSGRRISVGVRATF
ncbi:TonB-dependent receptor [Alteromonas gilva]|uniref:TonB-dependent receptor n=1 Tax=Alteromonas gilva TaxID=2987522 RepID=A0ABT5KX65_9ALTE|nr:TonB-dependent receptor [Alteromonas gilva]MDC8829360.1 TonB-dependent receptor [Alteromonas gilva]